MAQTKSQAEAKASAAEAKTSANKALNQYEGMFLLPGTASTDLDGAVKLVRSMIEKHEGQILVIKKWDERKLAYELGKQKRGLFVIAFFKAPGGAIVAIERDVNLSDQVVRVMITKAEHLNPEEMAKVEPQPIIPREERINPWDRPDTRPPFGDRPPRDDRAPRDDRGPREERPHRDDRPARAPAPAPAGKE